MFKAVTNKNEITNSKKDELIKDILWSIYERKIETADIYYNNQYWFSINQHFKKFYKNV